MEDYEINPEESLPESIQEYALLNEEKKIEFLCERLLSAVPRLPKCLRPIMPVLVQNNARSRYSEFISDFISEEEREEILNSYPSIEYFLREIGIPEFEDGTDGMEAEDGNGNESSKAESDQKGYPPINFFGAGESEDASDNIDIKNIAESLKPHQKDAILNLSDGIVEFMWALGMCNPEDYLYEMKEHAPGPRLCGKVINRGSLGYRCYDCMRDDNACFCLECFEFEKHVGHNYRVVEINSGLCDCGDSCMWSPSGFCSKHRETTMEEDLTLLVPDKFRASTLVALKALTRAYAIQTIKQEGADKNKRIFSFLAVLLLLIKELGVGFGRLVAIALNEKYDFKSRSKLCCDSPFYNTPLWFIVKNSPFLSKKNEKMIKEMLFSLLTDPQFKRTFCYVYSLQVKYLELTFFKMYKELHSKKYEDEGINYDSDDDTYEKDNEIGDNPSYMSWNNSEDKRSHQNDILDFGVQLIPSNVIDGDLNLKTGFIKSTCEGIYYLWKPMIDPKTGLYAPKSSAERLTDFMFYSIVNSMYLFQRGAEAKSVFEFDKSIKYVIDLLTPLEGAGNTVLKLDEHVLYDRDSYLFSVGNFDLAFKGFLKRLVDTLRKIDDPTLTLNLARDTIASIWGVLQDRFVSNGPLPTETLDDGTEVIAYDITGSDGVSFIDPLGDYVSGMLQEALGNKKIGIASVSDLQRLVFRDIDISTFMKYYLEWPLRVMVLTAQCSANHWVRNGASFQHLINFCRNRISIERADFLDKVTGLQICAAVLPKEVFSATFLSRFGLCGESGAKTLRSTQKIREAAIYEALRYLMEIALGAYYLPGTSKDDAGKYHMIQFLSLLGSFTYSKGQSACENVCPKSFEKFVGEICTKDSYSGTYRVKDELWSSVNPYYIYFTQTNLSALEERLEEHSKRVSKPAIFECPKVPAAYPNPIFERLPAILGTRHVHELVARIICGEFCDGTNPVDSRLLVAALHIMLLALSDRRVCTEEEVNDIVVGEALTYNSVKVLCNMVKSDDKNSPLIMNILGNLARASTECMDICVSILGPSFAVNVPDIDASTKEIEEARKKKKKLKQKSIMAKFLKKHDSAFKKTEGVEITLLSEKKDAEEEVAGGEEEKKEKEGAEEEDEDVCVVCRASGGIMGYVGYIQRSNFLNIATTRKNGGESLSWGNFNTPLMAGKTHDPLLNFMVAGLDSSAYAQSCKHRVHLSCVLDLSSGKDEFQCPCCRKLSNTFIPDAKSAYWYKNGFLFGKVASSRIGLPSENKFYDDAEDDDDITPSLLDTVRCVSYTLASYEYAARGQSCFVNADEKSTKEIPSPSLAAYIENTPRNIASDMYECVKRLNVPSRAEYRDKVLPLLVGDDLTYKDFMLPFFESFNLLLMGFVLDETPKDADREEAEEKDCPETGSESKDEDKAKNRRRMISKLLVSEIFRAFFALEASGGQSKDDITLGTVLKYCVPYLRRAALLLSVAEEGVSLGDIRECDTDPYALMKFCGVDLALPASPDAKVVDLFKSEGEFKNASLAWDSSVRYNHLGISVAPCVPFRINVLEHDLMKLVVSVNTRKCKECEKTPTFPTICLICGKFLCGFGECCSRMVGMRSAGECNIHALETTLGACPFFIPKHNYVMFLSSTGTKGNVCNSPYVDSHGELDLGFERGKPMFLDQRRLMRLEKDILEYEIDALSSMDTSMHLVKYPDWVKF